MLSTLSKRLDPKDNLKYLTDIGEKKSLKSNIILL